MQWLLPRLHRYQALEPDVDIRISTTNRVVDLLADGVDFAVRHGMGRYPGLEVERLINDRLQPVCSPSILPESKRLSSSMELKHFTLLHDEHHEDWAMWLRAVEGDGDGDGVDPSKGPVFVDSNGAIDAAIAGRGIALVRKALVSAELSAGRLIMPFRTSIETPIAYYLVYDETALLQRRNKRFRDWLMAEADADQREYAIR
jgi:LysR family glycine cleavage system transcriptional activator